MASKSRKAAKNLNAAKRLEFPRRMPSSKRSLLLGSALAGGVLVILSVSVAPRIANAGTCILVPGNPDVIVCAGGADATLNNFTSTSTTGANTVITGYQDTVNNAGSAAFKLTPNTSA